MKKSQSWRNKESPIMNLKWRANNQGNSDERRLG